MFSNQVTILCKISVLPMTDVEKYWDKISATATYYYQEEIVSAGVIRKLLLRDVDLFTWVRVHETRQNQREHN